MRPTCTSPAGAARIVLADGTLVRAADDENADLFWACRGGAGGNFGINTGFVFDAVSVARLRATVFDVRVGFRHAGDGTTTLWLLGQRLGDENTLRRLFTPLLRRRPTRTFIEERGFWHAQDYLMEPLGAKEAYASKSLVPDRWPTSDTVAAVADWTRGWQLCSPSSGATTPPACSATGKPSAVRPGV